MTKTLFQSSSFITNSSESRIRSLGALVTIKASTEQTNGSFNLFDAFFPIGYKTLLHIHYAEDVAIYVLRGTLDIFWGTEKKKAEVGSFFFQPRGTPHGFRVVGNSLAHILYFTIPAGFDRFVIEQSQAVTDFESMVLEARYKLEILDSLPD